MIRTNSVAIYPQRKSVSSNAENIISKLCLSPSSSTLKARTLRIRRDPQAREGPLFLEDHLKKLFRAKCSDMGIPVITEQESRFITYCKSNFKNQYFSLKDMNLGTSTAKVIGVILMSNPNFSVIDLSKNTFGDKGACIIIKGMVCNMNIVHLDLSSNDITPSGFASIFKVLKSQQSIVSLNISSHEGLHRNRLGVTGCSVLGKYLAKNRILTHLNLSGTSIGNEGLKHIKVSLTFNKSLLSLDLSNNGIAAGPLKAFCSALVHTQVKKISFAHNHIGNEGCTAIASLVGGYLDGQCPLSFLNLAYNGINIKGILKLFTAMRQNVTINSLVLDGNNFRQGLSSEFVPFMHANKTLRSLTLNACQLEDSEGENIRGGLFRNQGLENLEIAYNKLENLAAEFISAGLEKNKTLKSLNLSGNKIKDVGGIYIIKSLLENTVLETLNLTDNRLQSHMNSELIEMARKNKSIISLKLEKNSIDLKSIDEVFRCLKRNLKLKNKSLVPRLKTTISELQIGTRKMSSINKSIRKLRKEKLTLRTRIGVHTHRFEEVKKSEKGKTDEILNLRKQVKENLTERTKVLYQMNEKIRTIEERFFQDTYKFSTKINQVTTANLNLEKDMKALKVQNNLKRSKSRDICSQLVIELEYYELELEKTQKTLRNCILKRDNLKKLTPDKEMSSESKERNSSFKAENSPCKEKSSPCKSRNSPFKERNSPCKERNSPCKERNSPCKERNSPCKEGNSPSKERNSPSKERNSPCKENINILNS